jgi:hypothetical protein
VPVPVVPVVPVPVVVVPVVVVPVEVEPVVPVVPVVAPVSVVVVDEVVVSSAHSAPVSAVSHSFSPQAISDKANAMGAIIVSVLICLTPLLCIKQVIFNNCFRLLQKKYESFYTIYMHERIKTIHTIGAGSFSNE